MHIAEFAVTNLASEKHEWSNCLFVFFLILLVHSWMFEYFQPPTHSNAFPYMVTQNMS